jgi:hypothetical protein
MRQEWPVDRTGVGNGRASGRMTALQRIARWHTLGVPILVELRRENGEVVRDLRDPNGGLFDGAGDFDRLLPGAKGLLRYIDLYGDTVFNRLQMEDLLGEVMQLLGRNDLSPSESRGLARLRALAEACQAGVHLYLWFVGD